MVWSSWGKSWGGTTSIVPGKTETEIVYVASPSTIVFPSISIVGIKDEVINKIELIVRKRTEEMIKLDPNSENILEFDIDVSGTDPAMLEYHLRLYCENFHLGFKGRFNDNKVTFEVPPLYNLVKEIQESMKLKFEVNDKTGKFYLNPLTENISVEPKIELKAKIKEELESAEPKIEVKLTETQIKPKKISKIFE